MVVFLSITLIVLLIALMQLKSNIKGVVGEKSISSLLYFLGKGRFKVINNVVIRSGDRTAQIDHIVISDFGIFVIETKNYKGWILGGENSEYWTQIIYQHRYKFYNPIRQNLGHITALKSCLREYPHLNYKSIIVFSSKAEIKVNTVTDVVKPFSLIRTIKKYREQHLTEAQKENIFRKVKVLNAVDTYNKSEHITSIKRRIKVREASIRGYLCPQCGSNLVEREGRFGPFLGCESYPRCKFSRNLS